MEQVCVVLSVSSCLRREATATQIDPENLNTEDLRAHLRKPIRINCASTYTMARKAIAKDQIVKLIVGAGQASPSPPVGPALGSKGVKSMDFCKVRPPRELDN